MKSSCCQRRHHHILSLEDHVKSLNVDQAREQDYKDRLHDRLNAHTSYRFETDCWIYLGGSEDPRGRIRLRVGHSVHLLGRVAAWLYLEDFSLWDGRFEVIHTCAELRCFNPEHLRVVRGRSEANAVLNRSRRRRHELRLRRAA